ncbi:hypothetical protein GCM10020000_75460 [Streptomyces olivoverticillatus]
MPLEARAQGPVDGLDDGAAAGAGPRLGGVRNRGLGEEVVHHGGGIAGRLARHPVEGLLDVPREPGAGPLGPLVVDQALLRQPAGEYLHRVAHGVEFLGGAVEAVVVGGGVRVEPVQDAPQDGGAFAAPYAGQDVGRGGVDGVGVGPVHHGGDGVREEAQAQRRHAVGRGADSVPVVRHQEDDREFPLDGEGDRLEEFSLPGRGVPDGADDHIVTAAQHSRPCGADGGQALAAGGAGE